MKYRTQSANVLSDADRFQGILDVQLFVAEQDARIWGDNPDVEWYPGDPLYMDPRDFGVDGCNCPECEQARNEGFEILGIDVHRPGNTVRPMIQLLIDGDPFQLMRCQDCQVSWNPYESVTGFICWMCGNPRKSIQERWIRDQLRAARARSTAASVRESTIQDAIAEPISWRMSSEQIYQERLRALSTAEISSDPIHWIHRIEARMRLHDRE